jgi:hypothetical protein
VYFGKSSSLVPTNGTPIISKTVPAGAYVLEARVAVLNGSDQGPVSVQCRLDDADAFAYLDPHSSVQLEITSAVNHSDGAITLRCFGSDTDANAATLLATKVGSVG